MTSLQLRTVASPALHIPGTDPWHARGEDPALTVMTDFRERASITVADTDPIDAALEHMKHTGVRCAFAVDAERHLVIGLITPPVGTVLYVGCGVANIKLGELVQKLWPLVLVELIVLAVLIVFPSITLVPLGWFN